jgi:predicted permease
MAAAALYAPMSGDSWNEGIRVEGQPEPPAKEDTGSGWAMITPDFFDTIGAKIVLGRPITDQDTATTRNVAVINEAFARKFFKDQNPIGQHFGQNRIKYSAMYEVVGVARDIRYMTWGIRKPVRPMFWTAEAQTAKYDDPAFNNGEKSAHYLSNIVIWAPGNPPGMEERLRQALTSVDPNLVIYTVNPYDKVVSNDFQQEAMIATLTSLFGALGLLLAAVGLYGVLAYMVEQRTREIGLRMALGADRVQVTKLVLSGAFVQIGIGLAIGIPAAIAAGKLMSNQLFGVQPWDPMMLAVAALMLGLAALLASAVPARRAAGVEPMIALRNG